MILCPDDVGIVLVGAIVEDTTDDDAMDGEAPDDCKEIVCPIRATAIGLEPPGRWIAIVGCCCPNRKSGSCIRTLYFLCGRNNPTSYLNPFVLSVEFAVAA